MKKKKKKKIKSTQKSANKYFRLQFFTAHSSLKSQTKEDAEGINTGVNRRRKTENSKQKKKLKDELISAKEKTTIQMAAHFAAYATTATFETKMKLLLKVSSA